MVIVYSDSTLCPHNCLEKLDKYRSLLTTESNELMRCVTTGQFDLHDVGSKLELSDSVEALAQVRLNSKRVARLSQDLQQLVV